MTEVKLPSLDEMSRAVPLDASDLTMIVLAGAVKLVKWGDQTPWERRSGIFVRDLEGDLSKTLYEAQNEKKRRKKDEVSVFKPKIAPLIKNHYFFDCFGKSKEIDEALFELRRYGVITSVSDLRGTVVRPSTVTYAERILSQGKVSPEEYQEFLELGTSVNIRNLVNI